MTIRDFMPHPVNEDEMPGFLRTNSRTDKGKAGTATTNSLENLPARILRQIYSDVEIINSGLNHIPVPFTDSQKFCVLAAKIDSLGGFEDEEELRKSLSLVGSAMASATADNGGSWGWVEPDTVFCFIPHKNPQEGEKIAGGIKQMLSQESSVTLTVGIATYPMINFSRENILENAIKAVSHASFFGPDSAVVFDAVTLNISGDKLYQNGQIKEAGKEFSRALMIDPANVNLHNSLGVCHGMTGDYGKALNEFETACWLDEEELMALHNIGIIHDIRGDREKAIEYLSRAVSIKDDIFEILFHAGRLYYELKKYDKAIQHLENAARLSPDSDPTHRYIGKTYQAMDMKEKAISAYKRAVKLNPFDSEALSALGHLFGFHKKDAEISEIFCQKSVSLSPDNSLFRHRLGKALLDLGRKDEAMAEFERAAKLGFISSEDWENDNFSEYKQYYNV